MEKQDASEREHETETEAETSVDVKQEVKQSGSVLHVCTQLEHHTTVIMHTIYIMWESFS